MLRLTPVKPTESKSLLLSPPQPFYDIEVSYHHDHLAVRFGDLDANAVLSVSGSRVGSRRMVMMTYPLPIPPQGDGPKQEAGEPPESSHTPEDPFWAWQQLDQLMARFFENNQGFLKPDPFTFRKIYEAYLDHVELPQPKGRCEGMQDLLKTSPFRAYLLAHQKLYCMGQGCEDERIFVFRRGTVLEFHPNPDQYIFLQPEDLVVVGRKAVLPALLQLGLQKDPVRQLPLDTLLDKLEATSEVPAHLKAILLFRIHPSSQSTALETEADPLAVYGPPQGFPDRMKQFWWMATTVTVIILSLAGFLYVYDHFFRGI